MARQLVEVARTSTLLIAAVLLGIGACTEQTDTEPEVANETESEETGHEGAEHEEDEECSAAQQQRVDAILALTADQAAGAEQFAQTCGTALCHGPDGVSGPGPSLAEEVPEHSVDEIACVLLIGPGEMTSLETLTDQQLADVIGYVTATF